MENYNKNKGIFETTESEVTKMRHDSEICESLQNKKRELNYEISAAKNTIQEFYSKFPELNLQDLNFDHSGIKGFVCNLFCVKDPMFAISLNVSAGCKLYQLVVDTTDTGKKLLESDLLKRELTIIPMNNIESNAISEGIIQYAQSLVGNNNVFSALSLIDYETEYSAVMKYVFGSKLVCTNLKTAKTVALDPKIFKSSITLEGDQISPEGILSGGSKSDYINNLTKIAEYNSIKNKLVKQKKELSDIEDELNLNKFKNSEYSKLKQKLNKYEIQMNTAKTNLEKTIYYQIFEKKESLNQELKNRKTEKEAFSRELVDFKEQYAQLNDKVKNGEHKDEEKQIAQKIIQEKKKFIEDYLNKNNQLPQESNLTQHEINCLKEEIVGYNEELTKIKEKINVNNQQKEEINNIIIDLQVKI